MSEQRETITVRRPHVPFGPKHKTADEADADYLRSAAGNIRFARCLGSNLTDTVELLLLDAAEALSPPSPVPGTPGEREEGADRGE